MARVIAVTQSSTSLGEVESRFQLSRSKDPGFFGEWQQDVQISAEDVDSLAVVYKRLQYHRADGELLEGAVTLLVASPLLELAGFYDPPYKLRSEASVEISLDDGEEILRGRIDALILQGRLWVLVLEAKKTTIPLRSALPQLLTYLMANPQPEQPLFGVLTNGDEVLFVKLAQQPAARYDLSRAFSLYTVSNEIRHVFGVLKTIEKIVR
ncbi:MAG: type I restriction enzyme HsdR N-terminal domain-containing protein [Phormidesmis sp.]